jgi:hypothetical protein
MHLYLVVDCRTPGCDMTHVLKYLGPKGLLSGEIPISMPCPMWIRCPKCDLRHDYTTKDVRQMEMGESPPSDYSDKI